MEPLIWEAPAITGTLIGSDWRAGGGGDFGGLRLLGAFLPLSAGRVLPLYPLASIR